MKTANSTTKVGARKTAAPRKYRLRLYISGATPRSTQAIANIKEIGEKRLHGRYDLEVIDAYQQAELVRDEQIVVLPTLIKHLPLPLRRMVGDLSDEDRVLVGLGLAAEGSRTTPKTQVMPRRTSTTCTSAGLRREIVDFAPGWKHPKRCCARSVPVRWTPSP